MRLFHRTSTPAALPDIYWLARTEPVPVPGPLGIRRRVSLDVAIPRGWLTHHVLCVGSTGSGKSLSVLLPLLAQHIARGRGAMLLTFKHDPPLLEGIAKALEASGRRDVYYLSLRPEDRDLTCWWSPAADISDPAVIADAMVAAVVDDSPELRYYAAQCVDGLSILLEAARRSDRQLTMPEMASLLAGAGTSGPGPELSRYLQPWPDLATRARTVRWEHATDVKMMASRLSSFPCFVPEAGRRQLSLPDAVRERAVVIVVADAMQAPAAARYAGRMMVSVLSAVLSASGRSVASPLFILAVDEAGHVMGPHLQSMLARARGYGVAIILATQAIGDLRSAASRERAGGLAAQVVENAATHIYLSARDPQDARWIAEASGTVMRHYAFESLAEGGMTAEGLGTIHAAKRESPLLHPNKILYLPRGLAYIAVPSVRDCLWWPGGIRRAYPRAPDTRGIYLAGLAVPPGEMLEGTAWHGLVRASVETHFVAVEPQEDRPPATSPGPLSGIVGSLAPRRRGTRGGARERRRQRRLAELQEQLEPLASGAGGDEE